MKISEMNNEQATEAIIRLSEPLSNICDDEEAVALFNDFSNMGDIPFIQAIGKMIPRIVTYGLRKHKDDFYEIVGALTMQSTDKVAKMNFLETIKVIKESYDSTLADFFTHSSNAGGKKDEQ